MEGIESSLEDFMQCIPAPGDYFNKQVFFINGALLIQQCLSDYISAMSCARASSLHETIKQAKSLSGGRIPVKAWKLCGLIKNIRNEYAHNLRPTNKARRLENKFIYTVEKLQKYKGSTLFGISDHRNRKQWRIYIAFIVLFDYLRVLNGASQDESIAVLILKEFVTQMENRAGAAVTY